MEFLIEFHKLILLFLKIWIKKNERNNPTRYSSTLSLT